MIFFLVCEMCFLDLWQKYVKNLFSPFSLTNWWEKTRRNLKAARFYQQLRNILSEREFGGRDVPFSLFRITPLHDEMCQ